MFNMFRTDVGIGPYLPEVSHSDAGRGKLSGFRQAASLTSQLLFAGLVAVSTGQLLAMGRDEMSDVNVAICGNLVCFVWICVFLPMSWHRLGERPAGASKDKGILDDLKATWKDAKK